MCCFCWVNIVIFNKNFALCLNMYCFYSTNMVIFNKQMKICASNGHLCKSKNFSVVAKIAARINPYICCKAKSFHPLTNRIPITLSCFAECWTRQHWQLSGFCGSIQLADYWLSLTSSSYISLYMLSCITYSRKQSTCTRLDWTMVDQCLRR